MADYPGPRPDGPTLVYQGRCLPVTVDGTVERPVRVTDATAPGPPADLRWVVAYGANASPSRLVELVVDARGALLLPARMVGWRPVWEARLSRRGYAPLTLWADPTAVGDVWVLGVPAGATEVLDRSEGRGRRYLLGRVGEVAVAARFLLRDALAYGPAADTRVLADRRGAPLGPPTTAADDATALAAAGTAPTVAATPLPEVVEGDWPEVPLHDLDLVVYGTLMPGHERWPVIADLVDVVGPVRFRGRLWATPYGWPAARADAGGWVHGVRLRPRGPRAVAELYRRTDAVEGTAFRRSAVRVEDGRWSWAAVYLWAHGTPPGRPLADGRWSPAAG